MQRRFILVALVVLIAAIVAIVILLKRGQKSESIQTTGIVEGVEVNISTTVSGRIFKECCKEGDTVKEGDTLVELESDDIRASVEQAVAGLEKAEAEVTVAESAVDGSKANIKSAEADIKNAEAETERARAQMEEAKREMERLSTLYKQGIISKQSLDIAVTNHDTTVANYKASKSKVAAAHSKKDAAVAESKTAERRLTSAKASFKQSTANLSFSRAKLAETIIKSPISGTVVFKALERGEAASPGTTILTIVDLQNLYVRVDIEETLIGFITLNSEVKIRRQGSPENILRGRVSEIGRYADFATQKDVARGRQDIKTFKVKIALEDQGRILKPGMTVEVEIPKEGSK
ncbi:MAG: efflux RND transporter periplasmic adaptor subunit [Desulfobacteraceae bacterium]|nr:MAG: efflux RND transporter periplasmic adaptor subunit [Desulfobacteraceae bacterium]